MVRVLLLDESSETAKTIAESLESAGVETEITRIQTPRELRLASESSFSFDVVISSMRLTGMLGLEPFALARRLGIGAPFIVLSDSPNEHRAVEAFRAGVDDYVTVSEIDSIASVVRRVLAVASGRADGETGRRMQMIGRLAGGLAHELNNLLMVIASEADLIEHELDDSGRSELEAIRESVDRGRLFTDQLLSIGSGVPRSPELIRVDEFVDQIARHVDRELEPRVKLTVRAAPDTPQVSIDPSQLERVLMNLAANAREAIAGDGSIEIATSRVTVEPDSQSELAPPGEPVAVPPAHLPAGTYAVVRITDTGHGMDARAISHAFEPFFTTKKGRGSGLGLSSVYGIVRQNRGRISLSSQTGKGTTCTLWLPEADPLEPLPRRRVARASVDIRASDRTPMPTILLVEDEIPLLNGLTRGLTRAGFEVLSAAGGVEALELFRSRDRAIDVLVTDVMMPDMDGPSLAAEVVAAAPHVGVVFMSGNASGLSIDLEAARAVDFLAKPFPLRELVKRVERMLEPTAQTPRARG